MSASTFHNQESLVENTARIALISDYVDPTEQRYFFDPLRQSVCPFDVVDIMRAEGYPIWISPIETGPNSFMYEITLDGVSFTKEKMQAFLASITAPLALDAGNRVRLILGHYSIVITTTRKDLERWPNLEAVLRLVTPL
jgi:hypothetical protein